VNTTIPLASKDAAGVGRDADPVRLLPDDELLRRLSRLLSESRRVEWQLVAHIGEVDARMLYARAACDSMFVYCTEVLHLSGQEAYLRITAARAAREHPVLLAMLADGRLHLSGIAKLAPHLNAANGGKLLERAVHKTKRQIEVLLAEWAPRPDVPTSVRKLPERSLAVPTIVLASPAPPQAGPVAVRDQLGPDRVPPPAPPAAPPARAVVEPIAPARYKVQFTATAALCEKLDRLKELMRTAVPDGDLARILEIAVGEALERREARRFAKTSKPRKTMADVDTTSSSRYLPAPVRRAVHARDDGRCRYVDASGRRCGSRRQLEFHHVRPWALGGDRSTGNLHLLCRTHNASMAAHDYGAAKLATFRKGKSEGAVVVAPAKPADPP
jgi:5-methylcytosine-specific restriction endonuclease McrA